MRAGRFGFTLLEVMIALAILSVVAVAFLRAQAGSMGLVRESSQISLATLLARQKMAELESAGFAATGKSSGPGGEFFPSFRWEREITSTDLPNVRKALIRILWVEEGKERLLEFTAFFARR